MSGISGISGILSGTVFFLVAMMLLVGWLYRLRKLRQEESDPSTGARNRMFVERRLKPRMARMTSNGTAVLNIDVAGTSTPRRVLGDIGGDATLAILVQRAQAQIRDHHDVVIRWGTDQLLVVLTDMHRPRVQAKLIASRLAKSLREPIVVDGATLEMPVDIGISFAMGSSDTNAMIADAQTALIRAREHQTQIEVQDNATRTRVGM